MVIQFYNIYCNNCMFTCIYLFSKYILKSFKYTFGLFSPPQFSDISDRCREDFISHKTEKKVSTKMVKKKKECVK